MDNKINITNLPYIANDDSSTDEITSIADILSTDGQWIDYETNCAVPLSSLSDYNRLAVILPYSSDWRDFYGFSEDPDAVYRLLKKTSNAIRTGIDVIKEVGRVSERPDIIQIDSKIKKVTLMDSIQYINSEYVAIVKVAYAIRVIKLMR